MKKSLWVICVLLVALLAGLMVAEEKTKDKKTTQMELINENSEYYENKLASLKAELEEKRAAYEHSEKNGYICLAAKVSSASELNTVYSWLDEYKIPLTVIVNTSDSSSAVSPILRAAAAHGNSSIMYCGSMYDWAENTEDMDVILSQNNLSHCGIAYFDYTASYSQITAAYTSGMRGYSNPFTSSDGLNAETKVDGMYSVGHILLSDTNSITNITDTAAKNNKAFILTIDMNEFNISFSETSAKQLLASINTYLEKGTLQAVSTDEYMEHLEGLDDRQIAKAEFEAYETQTLAEIAELEATLKEMYTVIE